jgi:hypothetical protein
MVSRRVSSNTSSRPVANPQLIPGFELMALAHLQKDKDEIAHRVPLMALFATLVFHRCHLPAGLTGVSPGGACPG